MRPDITPEKVQLIYEDLSKMALDLDPDPIQFGPKRLNEKVAICRGHLTRCERIFLQVAQDLHWYKRSQKTWQTEFDIRMRHLIANDPEVMAGRSVKDRESIASNKLSEVRHEICELQVSIDDLEHLIVLVKAKRSDLKDTQGRIRDQFKICQEELGLGARWGSPNNSAFPVEKEPKVSHTGGTIEEFDSLLDSTILDLKTNEAPATPESVDVDFFLDAIPDFF